MKQLLLFLLLFMFCVNSFYAQDKKVYLPKGERHPYFNKFTYILDDDTDHYFLTKVYRLLEAQKDISIDFLLFNLEKEDVYKLPLPKDSVYQTEPKLSPNPQEGYEYTILWKNGNKKYILNASNRYKERSNELNLFFKGITLLIEEDADEIKTTKEVKVKCWIGSYGTLVEYINEDRTAYLTPPKIKQDMQKWTWLKEFERYTFPYVECRIDRVSKKRIAEGFNIFIRDYFFDGFTGIPTEQTIDITGNRRLANRYLKKQHIQIRETPYSRNLIEQLREVNVDFDSIQPLIRHSK
ncbi:MAG: hypothetical protein ACK5KL_05290 [Dysgonomonas sp.]